MGQPFASVLANINLTDLGKIVVQKLTISGMINFYCRYVDDTLLSVTPADIGPMHNLFNKFDKSLCFTVDRFENEVPHFVNINLSQS